MIFHRFQLTILLLVVAACGTLGAQNLVEARITINREKSIYFRLTGER